MTVSRGPDITSIQVRRRTLQRLAALRAYPREPLNDVVLRLIKSYRERGLDKESDVRP